MPRAFSPRPETRARGTSRLLCKESLVAVGVRGYPQHDLKPIVFARAQSRSLHELAIQRRHHFRHDLAHVQAPAANGEEPRADIRTATPGYFETMKIALRTGRFIDSRDRQGAPDEALA